MTTVLVWVAIISTGDYRGGMLAIDNIASRADCERVVQRVKNRLPTGIGFAGTQAHCTQYRKVVAK